MFRQAEIFGIIHSVHYSSNQSNSPTNAHSKDYRLYISLKNPYMFLRLGAILRE
jgi:hypothetical protein